MYVFRFLNNIRSTNFKINDYRKRQIDILRNCRRNSGTNHSFPLLWQSICKPNESERNFAVRRLFWDRISRDKMCRIIQQFGDGLRLGDGTPECLAHWLLFVTKNGDQKSQSLLKG